MQWLVTLLGLAMLGGLARVAQKRPLPSHRDVLLEDELAPHLNDVAARKTSRRGRRMHVPTNLSALIAQGVGYLNRRPTDELLPACRWLSDNGRFLQETTASLRRELSHAPKLPSDERGTPRVLILARELLGHGNAELKEPRLHRAIEAWQQREPLTNDELNLLPQAIKTALLEILREMLLLCVADQRAFDAAPRVAKRLSEQGGGSAVERAFERHKDSDAFVTRLLTCLRASGSRDAIEWVDRRGRASGDTERQERERQTEHSLWVGNAITSLRMANRMPWSRLCEEWSETHRALQNDAVYPLMDEESRAYYRARVAYFAGLCRQPEPTICDALLTLSARAEEGSVEAHVGYYLLDGGEQALMRALHATEWRVSGRLIGKRHALTLYRVGEWLTFAGLWAVGVACHVPWLLLLPFAALFLATYHELWRLWARRFVHPRMTPRLQIDRLSDERRTLVICPTLLTAPEQALAMARHLSILHQANPDPNLHFLLLGDPQESLTETLATDAEIVRAAATAVQALCEDTGHPFFYLHRARMLNPSDHLYMSRERKRGGVETMLKLIEGQPVEDAFLFCSCPKDEWRGRYRYVITLDSDTLLPPGSALRLVGAMAHPLQRFGTREDGYRGVAVIQPRMSTLPHAIGSRLALLLGGSGGAEPYNALTSELWQDVLGRGTFVGKGIIDPKAFLALTEGKIAPNSVLSHDLLEGELTGCRQANDIVLYESHPPTLKGWLMRLHRWTRGDWQLLPYLLPRGRGDGLDGTAKHKMWGNLLRSMWPLCKLLLLIYAAAMGRPWLLAATLLADELPLMRDRLTGLPIRLMLLPCTACIQADAAARALWRMLVSRRGLLQWTTAAQTSLPTIKPSMLYFNLNMGAACVTAALGLLRAPVYGLLLGGLWALFPFLLPWLERPYHASEPLTDFMREQLKRLAGDTYLFFDTFVTDGEHDLPPDNVQLEPNKGVAHRTSPTNIGLYLTSLIAAQKLGLIDAALLGDKLDATVSTLESLEKWNGLPFNWYDTQTLEPLDARYVSSVDCGNLAVCLLCCAQGVRVLIPELSERHRRLAERLDALASAMRFETLYDWQAELFWIGARPDEPSDPLSHYDLLASEARLLSFVAIMLGCVPERHWHRLGRGLTRTARGCTLVSYSGTMFEYMMPLLFQPPVKGTLLHQACTAAFAEQRRAKRHGVFGVSESGYYAFDPALHYQYKAFGVPSLALDPVMSQDVVAPYATALTLSLEPKASFLNLRQLQGLGLQSALGLFEAVDFKRERIGATHPYRIVRSHMAHHQGMVLCAVCNALCDQYVARLFSDLPRAQAFATLLEERAVQPRGVLRHPLKRVENVPLLAAAQAKRSAHPLYFPMDAQLLFGGGATVAVDAQGGGFYSRDGVMATRFRELCAIPSGFRCYVRDSQTGEHWLTTDPTLDGETEFAASQACFTRRRSHVETTLCAFVNPLDGAMLHRLTVRNLSDTDRMTEICTYLEPSLAPQRDDLAHPSFQNLFVRTVRIGKRGVMAERRPRKHDERRQALYHMLSSDVALNAFHVQTDRTVFLGRGQTVLHPASLELPVGVFGDRVGDMIEPCLSLRAQFVLPAKGKVHFLFATQLARPADTAAAFVERYALMDAGDSARELAVTQGQVTARFLDMTARELNDVGRLVGSLLYTGQPHQYRYSAVNELPLRELWAFGISGDLPILLVRAETDEALPLIRLLLKAHAGYRLAGLWVDLVIVCRAGDGSVHPLLDTIDGLMRTSISRELIGKEGGLHLLAREKLTDEQHGLLCSCARIVLDGDQGSLYDQLQALLAACKPQFWDDPKPSLSWKQTLPPTGELLFDNTFGGFSDTGYVIELPATKATPAPWCNVLAMPRFGTLASESGLVFSYFDNSHDGRLTRWHNDSVTMRGDEQYFLRDAANRLLWSATRCPLGQCLAQRVTHEQGATLYESANYGLYTKLTVFTDSERTMGLRTLAIRNDDDCIRELKLYACCDFALSTHPTEMQLTAVSRKQGIIYATNPSMAGVNFLCMADPMSSVTTTMSSGAFWGLYGQSPTALATNDALPCDAGSVGVICLALTLKPRESATVTCALGHADTREQADELIAALRLDGASLRLHLTRRYWERALGVLRFDLPDPALSLMMNRWLPYQVLSARIFARAGFYQAGGAYGFRDQLQDMLSQLYTAPERVREHLLLCAAHQFEEGDVQHWWHPPQRGVRTRISDDLLFLPFVTAAYVRATGDVAVLREEVAYLHGEPLGEDEQERYEEARTSELRETLHLHCLRAIDHVRMGAHGLPLMGGGDWNDGMNRVGGENGESVWLAMFYCEVLRRYLPLCEPETQERLKQRRLTLLERIDREAWDGEWYLRAWFDDGAKLGSADSTECRIDLLSQSWAVLAGLSRERSRAAMNAAWNRLFDAEIGILKLFEPPFSVSTDAGYIAGYLPGIRENGGQYTHAVPWTIAALHLLGRDDLAWRLTNACLPIHHARTRQEALRYRVEPYVMAADIYANPTQRGRGGWTWYTGSASWLYATVLEELLGFQKRGNRVRLIPSLPEAWDGMTVTYRFGSATYHLHAQVGAMAVADGEQLTDGWLTLEDDGRIHEATFPVRVRH